MSIANKERPNQFKDYVAQFGAVNYIKSVIKDNSHPDGIILSGQPGSGKTTLASLYVKGTLCLNRQEGEYEPCGECSNCTAKEPYNVTTYRVTEASAFKDVVGDLISLTKAAPIVTEDEIRDDQLRRFIIIDEVQNASRASIGPFLDSLEFSHDKLTIILISMDLTKMDPIVRNAVESRCVELSLDSLSVEDISNKLCNSVTNIKKDCADLIAYLAKGNMRKAWSLIEFFTTQMPIEDLTTDIIYKQKFGGMSRTLFNQVINSLQNSTWANTRSLLKKFSAAEELAVDMFIRTLIAKDLSIDGIQLVSSLSTWYQCMYKAPLESAFLPYQGRLLIDIVEKKQEITMDNKNIEMNITQQLAGITGKSIHIEENKLTHVYNFFKVKSWNDLIKYYAKNNTDSV